jgi:glycosyltransferase involved in cell wall biosynthesis
MNVLYLYIGKSGEKKPAFCDKEAKKVGVNITARAISNKGGKRAVLFSALTTPLEQKNYDVIVTTEYFIAFAVNLRLQLFGKKVKHIVYGMNQSARLLTFSNRLVNRWVNRVFNKTDLIVTHSRAEMKFFHHAHNIDIDKLVFSHWGFDLPDAGEDMFASRDKEYLSFVGRNNRDLKAFCHAIKGMDVSGIIITSANNAPDFTLPENVEIHYDLNMDACLSCMRHAKINVVLVKDDERGAGHITIVASMLMKKPQIISDVSVVKEYFVDGVHGVSVPVGDSESVKLAIIKLLENDVANVCGEQAYEYASKYFVNDASSKRLVGIVQSVVNNKKPDTCNSAWLSEYQLMTKK